MRSEAAVKEVRRLAEEGLSSYGIAKSTGVPRSTVGRWLRGESRVHPVAAIPPPRGPKPAAWPSYAYLLGLYLGDGWVGTARTSRRLELTLDSSYPQIIEAACEAIAAVYPTSAPRVRKRRARCVDVIAAGRYWPSLFPQHGPGRKHERRIELLTWQRIVTHRFPAALVRGLIHSDGCRCLATVRRKGRAYTYPRYYLSNRSEDILEIFGRHLDVLGVAWTRSYIDTIQVARREAVARLDLLVGPKR